MNSICSTSPSGSMQGIGRVDRFIRIPDVEAITGLSRTTVWRLEQKGEFPKRIQISPNAVAWRLGSVQAWMDERVARSVEDGGE